MDHIQAYLMMLILLEEYAQSFWEIGSAISLGIYCIALMAITIYCLLQFHLLFYYKTGKRKRTNGIDLKNSEDVFPFVTIQLPIFNEMYVVQRLLQSITAIDYPKDKIEIQVLDDSTDQTVAISQAEVDKYTRAGFDIKLIHRKDRTGYKAGALKSATESARGEFIAIFDADFLPKPSFLKDTLGYFHDSKIGVVQTRWEHLNQDYSILTRVQALQLNVHFTVEQLGRKLGNLLLQFNGTAGIWRKETINDAGGWEADTLTEDLDLSYRAQLKGWKIIYLEDVVAPAELPAEINGLKSQQYRWMKGGAETAKKVLPKIWKSDLSLRQKIHGSVHLLGSTVFLAVFAIGIFSVPLAMALRPMGYDPNIFTFFLIGLFSIILVYYVANVEVAWPKENRFRMILKFLFLFPIFLALSMGLSFHNSIAVIQGYLGKKSAFIRTPKFNVTQIGDQIIGKQYLNLKLSKVTLWEGFFALYFLGGLVWGIVNKEPTFILMHLILAVGYGLIFYFSVKNVLIRARSK